MLFEIITCDPSIYPMGHPDFFMILYVDLRKSTLVNSFFTDGEDKIVQPLFDTCNKDL